MVFVNFVFLITPLWCVFDSLSAIRHERALSLIFTGQASFLCVCAQKAIYQKALKCMPINFYYDEELQCQVIMSAIEIIKTKQTF